MFLPAHDTGKGETTMKSFKIQGNAGVDFGTYEADDAQGALDAMARDAGYKSHADACEATGEQTDDWTTDRYKFLGGSVSVLVTEEASS